MNHSGHVMAAVTTAADPHAGHDMSMMGHGGGGEQMNMDHGAGGHGGMMMYFHISFSATILFEKWTVDSWQGMLWSCVVIFIMAAMYEGLKVLREHLLQKYSTTEVYHINGKQPVPTSEEVALQEPRGKSIGSRMCSVSHLLQTILHIVQIVVSYFLMLIFMTYNFYLCLAVAVGAGTGYFLFSWRRSTIIDINEHCH